MGYDRLEFVYILRLHITVSVFALFLVVFNNEIKWYDQFVLDKKNDFFGQQDFVFTQNKL